MIIHNAESFSIDLSFCKQCGACVGVCRKSAIRHIIDPYTGLMKLEIDQEKCIKCGLCYNYCPAREDFKLNDVYTYAKQKRYYIGHNSNDNVRRNASSGGVARTIIIEGLKAGLFDSVYTLRKTTSYPFAEGFVYTKDNIPEYNDIPNSIYHSVPAVMNLLQIKPCGNLLLVGTSCQLAALKKYAVKKCENLYTICIFCKQQKTFESSRFMAKLADIKLNDIYDVNSYAYRGNGWPGYCMFNGTSVPWGVAALMPFGKKLWSVPGCDVCGNPFGEDVDLSLMDPWTIDKTNKKGHNVVTVHTDKGDYLLNKIQNMVIESISFTEVEPALMLPDIVNKNKYIDYFRGSETDCKIIKRGDSFQKQRRYLMYLLNVLPKLPNMMYKILVRIIKDKRQ